MMELSPDIIAKALSFCQTLSGTCIGKDHPERPPCSAENCMMMDYTQFVLGHSNSTIAALRKRVSELEDDAKEIGDAWIAYVLRTGRKESHEASPEALYAAVKASIVREDARASSSEGEKGDEN